MKEKTIDYYAYLLYEGDRKEALGYIKADIMTDLCSECFTEVEDDKRNYSRQSFQLAYKYINKLFSKIKSGHSRFVEMEKKRTAPKLDS